MKSTSSCYLMLISDRINVQPAQRKRGQPIHSQCSQFVTPNPLDMVSIIKSAYIFALIDFIHHGNNCRKGILAPASNNVYLPTNVPRLSARHACVSRRLQVTVRLLSHDGWLVRGWVGEGQSAKAEDESVCGPSPPTPTLPHKWPGLLGGLEV